jgi:hypothetical protein
MLYELSRRLFSPGRLSAFPIPLLYAAGVSQKRTRLGIGSHCVQREANNPQQTKNKQTLTGKPAVKMLYWTLLSHSQSQIISHQSRGD